MSRIKRMAGALMITGALLNLAPTATAAEAPTANHCFVIDHPAVCLVICTYQNQSVKSCGLQLACNGQDLPTFCYVLGEVWGIVP